MDRVYRIIYKALGYAITEDGHVCTKTFNTKKEAQAWAKKNGIKITTKISL